MAQQNKGTTRREFVAVGAAAAAYGTFGFRRTTRADHHETAEPITQIVKFRIIEGQEESLLAMLSAFIATTEQVELGVLTYLAHRSKEDPSEVVLFEVYKDEAAYETHRTAPHWASISTEFTNAIELPLDVQLLDRIGGFSR